MSKYMHIILKYIVSNAVEYLLVFLIFATGVWTLFLIESLAIKIGVITGLAGIYFIWAIWHHLNDDNELSFEIVMEYFAVIALVIWILLNIVI